MRFLVMHHYTSKHQRHADRLRRKWEECATVLSWCEDCDRYVEGLKQHRQEKHQSCETCGRIYGSMEKLRRHMVSHTKPGAKLVRPKLKVFQCRICKQNLVTERHVARHFSTKHQHFKTNKYAQKTGRVLQVMTLAECATILWYCKHCDSYVAELESHRQDKHQCCRVCGKIFSSVKLLHSHGAIHAKTLLCYYCGSRYKNKQQLDCHIKMHLGDVKKDHKCDVCCKSFWTQRKLVKHKRIHSNE